MSTNEIILNFQVVQLAEQAQKRGARAQAKMDKFQENLELLKSMDRDAFLDFFSQEDVCENVRRN
jgi:hypothetical protein